MTTQQESIAHWYGLEAAFGAMQESQELPCPHDAGVFVAKYGIEITEGNKSAYITYKQ